MEIIDACLSAHRFMWFISAVVSYVIHLEPSPLYLSTEELVSLFNTTFSSILDYVVPLTLKKPKAKHLALMSPPEPSGGSAEEHKWKCDKLLISSEILRDNVLKLQEAVKSARTKYFSDLVSTNSNNATVLFSTNHLLKFSWAKSRGAFPPTA